MIKVFNIRELIKYFFRIVIPIIIVLIFIKTIPNIGKDKTIKIESNKVLFSCLEEYIGKFRNSIKNNYSEKNNVFISMISREMNVFRSLKNENNTNEIKVATNEENSENKIENNIIQNEIENNEKDSKKNLAEENVNIEVIKNNVTPRYNREYQGVKINNQTDYNLTDEMLNSDEIKVNNKKVVIYHTHTSESFTPSEKFNYTQTGNFRTQDSNFNMIKVGDELEARLKDYGIDVIHDKTYHDYPSYNGSYSRSLKTIEKIKQDNSDADIFIDLHRDAIADSSYAPKVKIGDEFASQLMFVVGSDKVNKNHTNWNDNLKFAMKTQKKANELYNGLFKPIILRNSEYNGHVSKACTIIEVGSTGNTLEESLNSMKYLAKILSEI